MQSTLGGPIGRGVKVEKEGMCAARGRQRSEGNLRALVPSGVGAHRALMLWNIVQIEYIRSTLSKRICGASIRVHVTSCLGSILQAQLLMSVLRSIDVSIVLHQYYSDQQKRYLSHALSPLIFFVYSSTTAFGTLLQQACMASAAPTQALGDGVVGPAGALGHGPLDVLGRVLDVAGLAMQTVLRVDLQHLLAAVVRDVLVHACARWEAGRASARVIDPSLTVTIILVHKKGHPHAPAGQYRPSGPPYTGRLIVSGIL